MSEPVHWCYSTCSCPFSVACGQIRACHRWTLCTFASGGAIHAGDCASLLHTEVRKHMCKTTVETSAQTAKQLSEEFKHVQAT